MSWRELRIGRGEIDEVVAWAKAAGLRALV